MFVQEQENMRSYNSK